MDTDLRVSPDRHGGAVPTKLDFGRQGSFIGAIELCNGTAQCRKTLTGTMCPSYMVTRRRARHDARPRQRPAVRPRRLAAACPS